MILSFDPSGRLVDLERADRIDSRAGVEFFSGLLIPGMVNAHCHLELSWLRGRIPRGCGLAGFADAMVSVRAQGKAAEAERVEAAAYRDAVMYREGIVAVADICNGSTTFPVKRRSKIHYHNFIELFGLRVTDTTPVRSVADAAAQSGQAFSVTPHAVYSLQDAPFRVAAEEGDPLSIHFLESMAETELFAGKGLLWERNLREGVSVDFLHYGSPAGRITGSICGRKNVLLVHNTFARQGDVERIERHFASAGGTVTWVLCPRSNDYIESAVPPAGMLAEMGVRVAIGTDSLASNDSLSLVEELKKLSAVPLETRLLWATINGALALGIDSWAGSFEAGKSPGAVLLTHIDWERWELTPRTQSIRIL